MEENPDLPVYTDVEAVFKGRKTTDEKIQMIATCTLNGKPERVYGLKYQPSSITVIRAKCAS
jgi:hypothetical protein